MVTFRAPRGTRDLLPAERAQFTRLERIARDLAGRYGYREIEVPLFEQGAVFERGIGEVTDVVEKELFRVSPSRGEDRERWALRPEATAGICRAYVEHGMQTWPQPVKLTLTGPMFRYDRPQAGRYRQFWQWNVEAIGDPGPAVDAELIELGLRFYREAGLGDVEVLVNSIGDPACRPAYLAELAAYFGRHEGALPELERRRLSTNPLRLLDSKEPAMAALIAAAPKSIDRLCVACAAHFAAVRAHLDSIGVAHRVEPALVRGLDYYTRTTFEFYRRGAEGQQQALGGGGRYDGLVALLGGKPTPGIGFALGLDRVVLALESAGVAPAEESVPIAVVVGADPADTAGRLAVATRLRDAGLGVSADLSQRRLGRQLEAAVKEGAQFAVILGDELAAGDVQLRDLDAASQKLVPLVDLAALLRRKTPGA
ncbi:MAG TPA: histidine--tRNA ligase [Candidatus Nanopelagicales bacterium]|nr:histidine--tRNA ligase [Candidatus Nanopelagicales bacterium]